MSERLGESQVVIAGGGWTEGAVETAAVAGANSGGVAVVEPKKKMARWA